MRAQMSSIAQCQEVVQDHLAAAPSVKLRNDWDRICYTDGTTAHIRLSKTTNKDTFDIRAVCANPNHGSCSWTRGAYRTRPCGAAWAYLKCAFSAACPDRESHRKEMERICALDGSLSARLHEKIFWSKNTRQMS